MNSKIDVHTAHFPIMFFVMFLIPSRLSPLGRCNEIVKSNPALPDFLSRLAPDSPMTGARLLVLLALSRLDPRFRRMLSIKHILHAAEVSVPGL